MLVTLNPAANEAAVRRAMMAWGDANVLSRADQTSLLLDQRLWRLRVQILAFTGVLQEVMAIVISLIIYMLTQEKHHQIAILKLIGAGGLGLGLGLSKLIFPWFPRRVVIDPQDIAMLGLAIAVICGFASLLGIWRALKVRAQEVLS